MPKIKFDEAEIKAAEPLPVGIWYPMEFIKYSSKPSAAGTSNNHFFNFKLLNIADRNFQQMINDTKPQFQLIPCVNALLGRKAEAGEDLEMEALYGRKIEGFVVDNFDGEGNKRQTISQFRPFKG